MRNFIKFKTLPKIRSSLNFTVSLINHTACIVHLASYKIHLTFTYQVIPRDGGFSTVFSNLKSLFFVVAMIGMEFYAHYYRYYEPLFMFFYGFWFIFVGFNVAHEGHHGAVSKTPWINQLFRLGYNLFGESTLHWIQYHLGIIYTLTLAIDFLQSSSTPNTGPVDRMSHRKRRETKQQPSKARSGNQITCSLVSLHFLWIPEKAGLGANWRAAAAKVADV